MRRIAGTKHLSCFYCGKQTGLKYDGTITNFLCLSCDATNYLDKHGDITDPPVATDREAAAAPSLYARPQHTSAAASPDIVFCETCLKNQRLFTASLAQYLPDDPSHPDYDELDRNYYRYRRNLERRYPQVCDGCAGRVQQRIQQAGYTAKTDHLRRMMEKSRGRRSAAGATTRRAGALDAAATLGGWLWRGGLAAQLLWHVLHMVEALERPDDGMYDPDDAGVFATTLAAAKAAAAWLPFGDALMQLSIAAAILSSWWNPHFVQFTRGFTRHLLGFTRWYSFQGLIVFFRIFFRSVLSMEGGAAAPSQSARLSAHLATAGIMCFIYIMASRSIRVDTTPLFRSEEKPPTPRRNISPAKRKEEDSKTFSELCNEALDSTPRKGGPSSPLAVTPGTPNYASSNTFVPPSQIKLMQQQQQQQQRGFHESPLASASAFQPRSQQQAPVDDYEDDADAMDWSPSQPQHRAFRNTPDRATINARRPFGQSPTHADDGGRSTNPFWFKVPPAPTTPARQLRNPPNMPVLRQKPAERDDVFFSSRSDRDQHKDRPSSGGSSSGNANTSFRNPSFFAPEQNDEANSLADLLGESFTLGRGQQQQQQRNRPHAFSSTPPSPFSMKRRAGPQHENNNAPSPPRRQPVELVILAVLLPLWLLLSFAIPASSTYVTDPLRGIVLVVAGVIALSGTHELDSEDEDRQQPRLVDAALSALGVGELAAVCWVGWETWTARVDVRAYGAGVLAVMLSHHAARLLQA